MIPTRTMKIHPHTKYTMGFLFGHYDSRGGTMLIIADKEEDAKKILGEKFFSGSEPEVINQIWEESYIGYSYLHVPRDYDLTEDTDLEEEGRVLVNHIGRNTTEPLSWVENDEDEDDEDEDDEDVDFVDSEALAGRAIQLEFVPKGAQPHALKAWHHPRWNDDAFGFLIIK